MRNSQQILKPGDVVVTAFPGADTTKRRPGIVVSTTLYHTNRIDVIVGVVTTQLAQAATPTDSLLQDWAAAGLRQPSAFRAYLFTFEQNDVRFIGRLSDADWQGVQGCLSRALAVSGDVLP